MRDYEDAEFKVIRRPKRRGWISFDWRNFALLTLIALLGFARWLQGYLSGG